MATAKKTSSKKASSKKASSKKVSSRTVSAEPQKTTPEKKDGLFAVIETGGKQYQVRVGDLITIEKYKDEKVAGDKIVFDSVLLVEDGQDTTIGAPYIDGAQVNGEVEESGRAKKVEVSKFKSKSRYLVRRGHRQPFLAVRITKIK